MSAALLRWPGIHCTLEDFVQHVEDLTVSTRDLELFGEELCLACACAVGNEAAVRVFEEQYITRIDPALRRLGDAAFVDDAKQQVRQRMLVPPETRILTYAATGPLLSWLRVAALRLALNLRRDTRPPSATALIEDLVRESPVETSELPRYIEVFSAAIERAFATLDTRERNLLRLHHVDGLSLDRLGALFQVHRATVARWLAQARRCIFEAVEMDVRQNLNLSPSDFRSMLGLVRSYLDASLSGLLGGLPAPETP